MQSPFICLSYSSLIVILWSFERTEMVHSLIILKNKKILVGLYKIKLLHMKKHIYLLVPKGMIWHMSLRGLNQAPETIM